MGKPRSTWRMASLIFLILGAAFLLSGILSQAGIMKTSPNSHGDPRVVFPILGCAFLMVGAVLFLVASYKEKRRKLLLQTGVPVTGRVVSVKQLTYMQKGNSHPYVVYFTYESDGVQYHGTSHLLWMPPTVRENDSLTVMVDADHPKHCAVEL